MPELVACARMYNVAPAAAAAWTALFGWAAEQADVPLAVIDHAFPAPLDELWQRPDLGCAFMCGWPFWRAGARHALVAAPVPSPQRYLRRPVYFTDIVVRADSPYRTLADLRGARMAWTAESSHSGYNALRHHMLTVRKPGEAALFGAMVGPLATPRRVLAAVRDGSADAGPVDSYAHDLIQRHDPELVAALRTLDSTDAAPIPPLVASPDADAQQVERLRRALVQAPDTLLEPLLLAGFAVVEPDAYRVAEQWARAAARAGYPRLA